MGRGSFDKANSANQLLFGPRKRGFGPRPAVPQVGYDYFRSELINGRLTINHRIPLPRKIKISNCHYGQAVNGEYVAAQIDNVWSDPVHLYAYKGHHEDWLLISYSNDLDEEAIPVPGTHREMALLKGLAEAPGNEHLGVDFTFDNDYQLSAFISAYGLADVEFSGAGSHGARKPSQREIIDDLADFGILTDEQVDAFRDASSLGELWASEEGRLGLEELANHSEICLSRPLQSFRDIPF